MAQVRAEDSVELGAERIGPIVESPAIGAVVCLAAEEEAVDEEIANIPLLPDLTGGELVERGLRPRLDDRLGNLGAGRA